MSMWVFGMMLARELLKPLRQQCRTLVYPLLQRLCTYVMFLLGSVLLLTWLPVLQKLETLPLRNRLTALREHSGSSMMDGL